MIIQEPSLSRRRTLAVVVAIVVAQVTRCANAELILDDFDNPAEVTEFSNGFEQHPAVTEHVGELDATRELLFTARLTNPNKWSFDSDIRTSSVLSAELKGHTRTNANSAIITFVSSYTFSPLDLTENGANNAFLFDFQSYQGSELPLFFRVFVSTPIVSGTPRDVFAAFVFDLKFSDGPFSLEIPFSSFTFRDGSPGTPNLSTLNELTFDFSFYNPVKISNGRLK